MSNKTNEEKGIIKDVWGIKAAFAGFERRIEDKILSGIEGSIGKNVLFRNMKNSIENNTLIQGFFKRLAYAQVRPKRRYVYQTDKEGKQWAETSFNLKYDGTTEFDRTRTISQAEAQKILEKNQKIGRKLERHESGKVTLDGHELSSKEVEFLNKLKQQRENSTNKDLSNSVGNTLDGKSISAQKSELPKAASAQADKTHQNTPRSTISDSIQRIKAATSALSSKNAKMKQTKSSKSLSTPIKYGK